MKPAGLLLPLVGLASALTAAEPSSAIISREISAKIREGLPTYQPPAPTPAGEAADPGPQTTDPDVLVLPKLTVKEKRLPPDAADHLMSRDDLKRKMENIYLDTIAEDGPLNYFLNRFTIPILSPSKEERGRAIYRQRELDRLRRVNDTVRRINPGTAGKLERELDNSHTTRPAGGLRNK